MSSTAVQPDIFGDYDRQVEAEREAREQADERRRAWEQPATCPSCATTEPTGYLLRNNHGYQPDQDGVCGFPKGQHPVYGDRCVAQVLVTNHITYDARHNLPDQLQRSMARGHELNLDVPAIVAAARQEPTP